MNIRKKAILGLMATTLLVTPSISGAENNSKVSSQAFKTSGFEDVQKHWGQPYIEYLSKQGYINGYPDGTFQPNRTITREEAVKIIVSEKGFELKEQKSLFPDVKDGYWAEEYINVAVKEGIVTGYPDGTFGAKDKLTRGELSAILARAYDLQLSDKSAKLPYPDVRDKYWAYEYINKLHQNGAVKGLPNGNFGASQTVSRAEFSAFLERIVNPNSVDKKPSTEVKEYQFNLNTTLAVGDYEPLKLTVIYQDGSKSDVSKETTFKIENSMVAKIENGNLKALGEGQTVLTAEYKGYKAETIITVEKAKEGASDKPIVVTNDLKLDPITIKGFVFTHDGWAVDEGNTNPTYVHTDGQPVKPTWLDEAGKYYQELPEFSNTPIAKGRYTFNDVEGFDYGMALSFVMQGMDLTKDEFLNTLNKLRETKKPVVIGNMTFSYEVGNTGKYYFLIEVK